MRARFQIFALLALSALPGPDATAQGGGRFRRGRSFPQPDDAPATTNLYSLPRNEDAWFGVKEAVDEFGQGKYRSALDRLQKILDGGDNAAIETELQSPEPRPADKVYESVRRAALRALSQAPEAARTAYDGQTQAATGQRAEDLDATTAPDILAVLVRRFPCSSQGLAARRLLGDLALEQGDPDEALGHYLRLMDLLPAPDGSLQQRVALCRHLLARPNDLQEQGTAPGLVAGSPCTVEQFLHEHLGPPRSAPRVPHDRGLSWPNLVSPGPDTPALDEPERGAARQWSDKLGDEAVPEDAEGVPPRGFLVQPVADGDRLFVTTGNWAACYQLLTGERHWTFSGPLLGEDPRARYAYQSGVNPSFAYAGALGRTAGGEDIYVCSLLVPESNQLENRFFNGNRIMARLPVRRLFALHARSGKLLWKHWNRAEEGALDAMLQRSLNVCGAPLVRGDRVYVATLSQTGTIAFHVSCFDLRTGQPVFQTLVMSAGAEVNMFGNAMLEYTASPLLWHEGSLYGVSNLGLAFAMDAESGVMRWLSRYESIPHQNNMGLQTYLRPSFWMNCAPAIHEGVLVVTPIDSRDAVAFDVRDGMPLWSLNFDFTPPGQAEGMRLSQLLGVLDGRFVFSGTGIGAVPPRPPRLQFGRRAIAEVVRWPHQLEDTQPRTVFEVPRGAIAGKAIYYLSAGGSLQALDSKGDAQPTPVSAGNIVRGGNVFPTRGAVVLVGNDQIQCFFAPDRLRERARREIAEHPRDPVAHRKLADLLRGDGPRGGQLQDEAVRAYSRALQLAREQGMPEDGAESLRIRSGLFAALLERAEENAIEPERSLADLRRAREVATGTIERMKAQDRIFAALQGRNRELLAELQTLERDHPDAVFAFGEQEPMRAGLYCPWRIALILAEPKTSVSDPAGAVAAWQRVLARAGEPDNLDGAPAYKLAQRAIAELIAHHGQAVYAAFEVRARDELDRATTPEQLYQVTRLYPNASSAVAARRRLADLAAERGDLARLAELASEGSAQPTTGILRRLAAGAMAAGNEPLARALLARLAREHGDEVSDLAADQGRTFRAVVAALPPDEEPAEAVVLPAQPLGHQRFGGGDRVDLLAVQRAPGFAAREPLPMLLLRSGRLEAFEPKVESGARLPAPLWATVDGIEARRPAPGASIRALVAGPVVMLLTQRGVEAFRLADGKPAWRRNFVGRDVAVRVTLRDGMLIVWEGLQNGAERGRMWAMEPVTGTELWNLHLSLERTAPPSWSRQHALFPDSLNGRFRVLIVDLLTGAELPWFEPSSALLARHGLLGQLRSSAVHEEWLLAVGDTVVLHETPERMPERLLCIDFGCTKVVWSFELERGLTLRRLCRVGEHLALLLAATDQTGRLTILDARTGREARSSIPLGRSAQLLGGDDPEPAPAWLALTGRSRDQQGVEVTLLGLTGRMDARAEPLKGFELPDSGAPVHLCGTWLTLVLRRAAGDKAPSLILMDPLRRGPTVNLALRPPTLGPYHLQRIGSALAVQSQDAILLFGAGK